MTGRSRNDLVSSPGDFEFIHSVVSGVLVTINKSQPVRKERERIARRSEIMLAARKVFAERGYKNATLDEIAERAEFAKGTLYNYFHSKEDLFHQIIESLINENIQIAEAAIAEGGTTRDVFHGYTMQIIEYYKQNEDFLKIVAREMNRMLLEEEHSRITKIMQDGQKVTSILAEVLRKDVRKKNIINENPEELAQFFVSIVHDRSMRCFFVGKSLQSIDTKREAALITRLFFEGASI